MNAPLVWVVLGGSNVACLFLGYLFGRLTQATLGIEEHMKDAPPETGPPPESRVDRTNRRRVTALQLIAVSVAVIGAITAAAGYQITRNQDRLAGCVTGYSNALGDALSVSRTAQNAVNEQLDQFMQAVLEAFSTAPEEGRQKVLDAVGAFVQARETAKNVQRENPLPDVPRDACAELSR